MSEAGSPEDNQTAKAQTVLSSLDAALTGVSENLHDLAGLEKAIADLGALTETDLAALRVDDLSAADLDQARGVAQKLRRLEQNLHLRGSILTGFSQQLKELIEG